LIHFYKRVTKPPKNVCGWNFPLLAVTSAVPIPVGQR
jgi:hypothetical protein